jgi:hypothetical protein
MLVSHGALSNWDSTNLKKLAQLAIPLPKQQAKHSRCRQQQAMI